MVSRKKIVTYGASAFIIGLILGAALLNLGGVPNSHTPNSKPVSNTPTPGTNSSNPTPVSNNPLPGTISLMSYNMGNGVFAAALPEMTLLINATQYKLPVNVTGAEGYGNLSSWLQITPDQEQLLSQNGFVVLRDNEFGTVSDFYNDAYNAGMPIMITTDAVLSTFHVLFDEILKEIEMNDFIPILNDTVNSLLSMAQQEAQSYIGTPLQNASQLNLMYLEVAHALMQPSFTPTTSEAQQELQLISSHNSVASSPIFGYQVDYTQFVPRGHYTENEQLEDYFKTMMWFGQMGFDLGDPTATRAAVLLTWMVTGNESLYDVWQRIYNVTEFFVGSSDDLTFQDYSMALIQGGITSPEQILNDNAIESISQDLLNMNNAKILGTIAVANPNIPQEEQLSEALNGTAGLRFMGQRFVPDSYMFQQLVYPQVGTNDSPRLMPKGLDIASVLGSDLAQQILNQTEAAYSNYTEQIEELRTEFGSIDTANWTQNLYWSWLYTANTTLSQIPNDAKYPTFMTTPAWGYEKLETFEGTWTELRHDTILYAKQSTTVVLSIAPPYVPPPSTAYVEPYPDTYRSMIGLINMTINGLTNYGLLSSSMNASLTSFMHVSELFLNASTIELAGGTLDDSTQQQVISAATQISTITSLASQQVQDAAIVADVHTDPNTGNVLEEALGNLSVAVVIYADANGNLYVAAGPVYNYYEFTQPMSNRLTDETWRAMISAGQTPPAPDWTNNFAK